MKKNNIIPRSFNCRLDDCRQETINEQLKMQIDTPDENESQESDVFDSEEFDKLLDDFISSQLAECSDDETDDCSSEDDYVDEPENDDSPTAVDEPVSSQVEEEDFMLSIQRLTGLVSVKKKLLSYEKMVRFNRMRAEAGLSTCSLPLHAMFLGSPGTGKTTVAKRVGVMLRRAGVLSRGHVVVRERASLLGPYYSNEETKTAEAIEEAQGGILFIDEAYQLCQLHDPKDPGRFVIETLMTALADESRRDWMLILAGYPEEMMRMFELNPGLRSRIPQSNIYTFDDFSNGELLEIADNYLSRNDYTLSGEARKALSTRLGWDWANRDKTFGNARHVINMIQTEILPAMASRVIETGIGSTDELSLIQATDIPTIQPMIVNDRPRIGFYA